MFPRTRKLIAAAALCLSSATASAQIFGSWIVDSAPESNSVYAVTANDSGALFGQYCYPAKDSCVWLIGVSTSCEEGDRYPALANSDVGAQPVELLCRGPLENGLYRYVFLDFDSADNIARKAARVGIAFPLKDDQFRVTRFQLRGAVRALDAVRTMHEKRVKRNGRTTRDQLL